MGARGQEEVCKLILGVEEWKELAAEHANKGLTLAGNLSRYVTLTVCILEVLKVLRQQRKGLSERHL